MLVELLSHLLFVSVELRSVILFKLSIRVDFDVIYDRRVAMKVAVALPRTEKTFDHFDARILEGLVISADDDAFDALLLFWVQGVDRLIW